MKLCNNCLSRHQELCTKPEHPYDIGMCNECLQIRLVSFVFERPTVPATFETEEVGPMHGIEIVSENEGWLKEAVLSEHIGRKCVYCGQDFLFLMDLEDAVFAPGGIAHKACWEQFGNPQES